MSFDLANARIVNAPDVKSWVETAKITEVRFDGSSTSVKWSGPNWPEVIPAGWNGGIQYTLWLFRRVNDQVVGSAFIEFWKGREASGSSHDPDVPSKYHEHWFYGTRWAPINEAGPIKPNEEIGFLVSSGDARDSKGPYGPQERSNLVTFPATDLGSFTFATPTPEPLPTPTPTPTPVPTPVSVPVPNQVVDLKPILDRLDRIEAALKVITFPNYEGDLGRFLGHVKLVPTKSS